MEKQIKLEALGWRFNFAENNIRGLNYLRAKDVVQFDGSLAELMFGIKFAYNTEDRNAVYSLYPVIRNGATNYTVKQAILSRAFKDTSFEEVLSGLAYRISNGYVVDYTHLAELHWSNHEVVIEKPSEQYPNDILFNLDANSEKIESVCIHMDKITETPDNSIEVPVNICWYDPADVKETNVKCHKANMWR